MQIRFGKLLPLALVIIAACTGPAQTASSNPAPPEPDTSAFVGVTVLPMNGDQVLTGQTVIVKAGRIASVGPESDVEVPDGALRIEGAGRYLLPGLAEMHGHIPSPQASQQYTEDVLFLYLANGITTVRGMLGAPGQLELRKKAESLEILSPTLYLAGPSFSGSSVSSPEDAIEKVRRQKEEGWDLLKIHPGLTLAEYDAMAGTARQVGMRFAGHVPAEVGLMHALESGQETFDHLDGYIEYLQQNLPVEHSKLVELARMTRESGAWVVPTMALWETLLGVADLQRLENYQELRYMPVNEVDRWKNAAAQRAQAAQPEIELRRKIAETRKSLLKVLSEEGVLILMGTDAPQIFSVPGFSLRHELAIMAECGMTPYQILVSGTRNVGQYFKNADQFGTVEPGRRADLLLVEANPLEDINNVFQQAGVMVRGKWLPTSEIQQRLSQIAERQ